MLMLIKRFLAQRRISKKVCRLSCRLHNTPAAVRKSCHSLECLYDIDVPILKVPRVIEVAKRLNFQFRRCKCHMSHYVRRGYVIRTAVRQTPRRCRHHWFAQSDDINQIDDELFVSRQRLAVRLADHYYSTHYSIKVNVSETRT